MKYKPYSKYKKTDIEWLGDIPEQWNVVRLRYIFTIKKRISGSLGHDILSITQQGIKIKDTESNEGQNSQDYSKYQFVEIGDFAMNHMDLLTGFVDISKYFGVTSPDYRVFSLSDTINNEPQYFLKILQMCYNQKIFYPFGQGSSQFGRWRLPTEAFKDFWYPFPPRSTQQSIATFLDSETTRIDSLVVDYEEMIVLLQEKRQALISHAVTRGLSELVSAEDPEFGEWAKLVNFKDSGVEWLGEIPEEWSLIKLGRVVSVCNGSDFKEHETDETGIPVYGSGGIFAYSDKPIYNKPSVLLGRKGTIDKPLYVETSFWTVDTMFYTRIGDGIHPKFLYYFALTIPFSFFSTGTALPSMTQTAYGEMKLPLISYSTQKSIASFLDSETTRIDALIKETKDSIALLKEHRSALITNVVTGKINVEETA